MFDFLAAVAIVSSVTMNIVQTVIAYKKSKEPPKDPLWDAALQLTITQANGMCDPDTFAQYYEELKAFRDNNNSLGDASKLATLVKKGRG